MRLNETAVIVVVALATLMATSGCAPGVSGRSYGRDEALQAQDVRLGYVESVRPVEIEGTRSGVGTMSGSVLGSLAGSNLGKGSGRAAGAIGGAILGGLAGAAIEESATRMPGQEITVELDGGRMVAVTQATDLSFYPGDRVRVLMGYDGTARVAHY